MTEFEEKVWRATARIPKGKVSTYSEIAKKIGKPEAARAVGNALNRNPHAPRVPCHRVVRADGRIGGYAHGSAKKKRMLENEGIEISNGKITGFGKRKTILY